MVRRREILTSALALAAGGLGGADLAAADAVSEPDAPRLLRKMVQRYAAMRSYADKGTVTRYGISDSPYRIEFTSAYQSPSLFRFSFATPHPYPPLRDIVTRYDVGFDGTAAYFVVTGYGQAPKAVPQKDLNQALARATGISAGAAHTIGRLLLAGADGLSVLDLVEARLNADEPIDGIACYSISAQHPRGGEWRLWVEKQTLLLRKLKTHLGAQDTSYSEEVHESIRVNQPVDATRFKIDA